MKKAILLSLVVGFFGTTASFGQSKGQDAAQDYRDAKKSSEKTHQSSKSNDTGIDRKCAETNHSQYEKLYDRFPKPSLMKETESTINVREPESEPQESEPETNQP